MIEPDSSWRPSDRQEREAYEGFRALEPSEQALLDDVETALDTSGHDTSRVRIEINRTQVTLRGEVLNTEALTDVVRVVEAVPGVDNVVDRLVVASG